MYTVDASKPGAQEYYNSLFALYASWGVDFVKVDDISSPYHKDEIEMIRKAIDRCGRPIVLSLSPGPTPLEEAAHVSTHANMWRIIGDFWDNWTQLEEHFSLFREMGSLTCARATGPTVICFRWAGSAYVRNRAIRE